MNKNNRTNVNEMLLYLDILAYFHEFSHGGYHRAGEFLKEYFEKPLNERPVTMFNCFRSDKDSGVVSLLEFLCSDEKICNLKIAADSSGDERFSSVCLTDDILDEDDKILSRNIYFILGGNYRTGEYFSNGKMVSTWSDNLLGAVQCVTEEQKNILLFYDKALKTAMNDKDLSDTAKITVTVSGHSKAGNLAQFICLFRKSVNRCVTYEAEGFSKRFVRKYKNIITDRGRYVTNICPDMSLTGDLLESLPSSKRKFIRTGYMCNAKSEINPLCYHIPMSVLDKDYHLLKEAGEQCVLSKWVGYTVELIIRTISSCPLIDEESALESLGKSVLYFFKGRKRRAFEFLSNKYTLFLIPTALACIIFSIPLIFILFAEKLYDRLYKIK
ncbi:MAG: DUF2974 domain-containing protein [Ruminococcus sp.]|nr:DUF2974 domain-containing protein [Ruminococcus sp.]